MSKINEGGAFVVSKPCKFCGDPAAYRLGSWTCIPHYRYRQMRANAKRRGLRVPSFEELDKITPKGLICPDCGIIMNWLKSDGERTTLTLQHYRDGSLALVCKSCNCRHDHMQDDDYRDFPKDHKVCSICKQMKHFSEFCNTTFNGGTLGVIGQCRKCRTIRHREWARENRARLKEEKIHARA